MGHKILVWTVIGWLAVSAIPATGAPGGASESRKVHFALTGTLVLGNSFDGELGGLIGPGARIDLDLGKYFIISPEAFVVLYWDTLAPACTLNFRFGQGFFGLGPMITLTDDVGWKNQILLKAQVGLRSGMFLIEAVYITGRSSVFSRTRIALSGLTWGLVF